MQALAQLRSQWRALPPRLRAALAAGLIVAAAASIVTGIATHPARAALFATSLHPEQLAEVEERLASWNAAFTPTADNVVVDVSKRNDLLLRLSLAGVPHAHVPSTQEALAQVGMLTPQAVIDAQTRAGLGGDIEAGLRGIAGIDDARVIVAPAKPAEFADESSQPATASVRVRLRTGMQLSAAAVAGIRAFVAAGVAGLDPSHVTILDDRGVALGEPDAASADDAAALQRSLQSALDAAFGDGATIVRVRTELHRERVAMRDTQRAPDRGAPVASTVRSEGYSDGGKRYRSDERADDRGSVSRETLTETPPGTLRRLSAAVFVDRARGADLVAVRELAAATLGFDPRRGDVLGVAAVDFGRPASPKHDPWWLLYGTVVPLAPAAALGIALVLAVRSAMPLASRLLERVLERADLERAAKNVDGLAPARVRSALAREPAHAAAAIISALPAATATAVLELYPPHERQAIVERMQRRQTPLLRDARELLDRYG